MDMSPVSEEELVCVIKKSRSSSAEGNVPSSWKVAAVKLIPKSSANEDPSSPSNYHFSCQQAAFGDPKGQVAEPHAYQ